jgi:hypothetical protein
MNPEAVNPAEMKPAESSGFTARFTAESSGWLGSSLALVTALTGRADGLELRGLDVRAPWELPEGA